jgi:poly-gamma-glutamate capsule biosynthesis protein CapA/YwtB (metallophosphatase superfamily)
MKHLNQVLLFICLFFTIGLAFLIIASFLIESEVVEITPLPKAVTPAEKEEIKIILVGDIMLNRGVKDMIDKYGGGDFKFPFLKIADYLNEADIVFGNLEGAISDKGRKVGSINSFRFNPKSTEGLTFAGFDILSVANNHTLDYTSEALTDTFSKLKEVGIGYVGGGVNATEAGLPVIKEINGSTESPPTKIAFLAYTNLGVPAWLPSESSPGINVVDEENIEEIKEQIKAAKQKADILIVSLHAGNEYTQNLTKFQTDFSKAVIDAGADLVVGHHPHVVQPLGEYGQGYIAYSLGNFIFDQDFSEETMKGLLLKVTIGDNQIKEVVPVGIKINNFFQPEIKSPVF